MTLSILAFRDKWQEFDEAWKTRMGEEGPIDDILTAIKIAGDKKRIARLVPMVKEAAELFEAGDRSADAARMVGATLIAGGNPPELTPDLMRLADAAWSKEDWYAPFCELAGLVEGAPDLRTPWKKFAKMLAFQPKTLVFHPGGWGAGEVQGLNVAKLELHVKFATGMQDHFPMNAAIDIFDCLRENELKGLHFRDGDGIRKHAKKEPLDVLRTIVEHHHGKTTTNAIRNALMQIGIEGSAWSAWWRKARKLAENSEWFDVNGTPAKSSVALLLDAKDPTEAFRRQLLHANGVGEALGKVRDLFVGGNPDAALVEIGLEELERLAALETEALPERLAAWLLLREHRGETPELCLQVLNEVLAGPAPPDPSIAGSLWELFQALPGAKDQERTVVLLPELFGENWLDEVLPHLQHAAAGMVRPLVDAYLQAKRDEDLKGVYNALLSRPLRAAALLARLAAQFETEPLDDTFPTPPQRAQAFLSLANHLHRQRRGNAHFTRVCARLTDQLTGGADPLLRRLLSGSESAALRAASLLCQRGVDPEVDHLVTEICLEFDRHFFAGQHGPFWEGDTIWVTKAGLEARSGELKELREVKIPANEDAIGLAASYGDLSENAEWEAAMEEQRNLTRRAMEIEAELRNADLIENVAIPEDTVCPGTRVTYRETVSGQVLPVAILGPWDGDTYQGDQVVSYRAPLAAGLLGLGIGDNAVLDLPSGELKVEVTEITPLEMA
tara:strand:+ start:9676 stop:11862 length:2187 start_codon:yes stop_codon:yes gene_type:complete